METYIKGTFKRNIYSSKDGYVVGIIRIKETTDDDLSDYIDKQFTFTGLFHELIIDEDYMFYGEVVDNIKYGIQYRVNRYEKLLPEDKDGLVTFLSSDIFPGIGEKTAEIIVDTLGDNCLNMIIEDYECLLTIPKMTNKKALSIHDNLVKYNESYEIVVYLTNFGFSMKDSLKIYNHYKNDSIRIIENNIYELIDTIDGISFLKVDSLRSKTNIKIDDDRRICALVIYIMKELCFRLGDTYLTFEEIYNTFKNNYEDEISEEKLKYYLVELNSLGKIIIKDDKYILFTYYNNELYIAQKSLLLANMDDSKIDNIEIKIERLENYFNIKYNDEQKKAIKQSLTKNFSIITGGPGTGKTTIIKGICEAYKMIKGYSLERLLNSMVLLAPTGRAAKRMSEACNYPSYTIHRYLKWNKESNEFGLNEKNKSNAEFIIVDEVSMIDTDLLTNLLKALKTNVKLVFIGDYNQLESVSPGKILKDLIDSDAINTIFLKEIYRQDRNSYISQLAYEINKGEIETDFLEKKDDYNFIKCADDDILKACCDVVKLAVNKGYDLKKVQVLAPIYKGINGIDNLNKYLQNIFNPSSKSKNEVYDTNVIYRENDKILQLENMPDDNVFNGDIGIIKKIDKGEITIDFDGNIVKYQKKDYKSIKHGYAISIHKAQGSEFDIVVMPITKSYKTMLYKKIIYTGVTRAKKSLIMIGDPNSFLESVYKRKVRERRTNLKDLIVDNITRI